MSFPHEIKDLDPQANQQLLRDFQGERKGWFQVGPEKWLLPWGYREIAAKIYNFQPRKDDVWIATFPRSGTTWMQELIWLLDNNFNYEKASREPITKRVPFLEFKMMLDEEVLEELTEANKGNQKGLDSLKAMSTPAYEALESATAPRYIKTHLPFSLLPQNLENICKVVYIARNPKDVAVSFYHHNRLIAVKSYQSDFAKYWDYFEKNLICYSPYWKHVNQGWEKRSHPNVLFIFYEDMKKNLPSAIKKVAKFMNKECTEEDVSRLATHLDIKNFKNNPSVDIGSGINGLTKKGEQPFVRKGVVGGWHEEFTPELLDRADRWIEENLKHTDLRFPL